MGDLDADFLLGEVFALLRLDNFDLRMIDQRRPCTHDLMPIAQNLLAPALPVVESLYRRSIIKEQWRAEGAELAGKLGRRGKGGADFIRNLAAILRKRDGRKGKCDCDAAQNRRPCAQGRG